MTSLTKKLTAALLAAAAVVCIAFGLLFAVPKTASADTVSVTADYLDIGTDGVFKGLKDKSETETLAALLGNNNFSIELPSNVTAIAEGPLNDANGRSSIFGSYASKLVSVKLPEGLLKIGGYAFRNCTALEDVYVDNSSVANLTEIGQEAFYGCRSLNSIIIPVSLTSLGTNAFTGCSAVTRISYNAKKLEETYLTESPFKSVGNAAVTIGSTVNQLPTGLFYNTKIKEVTFNNVGAVVWTGALTGVFENCTALTDVNFSDGCTITAIADKAFSGCSALENINIPATVKSIGQRAFYSCAALESIALPEKLETIGEEAFNGCTKIITVTIPSNVKEIKTNAFTGCTGILEVVNNSTFITVEKKNTNNGYIGYYAESVINPGDEDNVSKLKPEGDFIFFDSASAKYLVRYTGNGGTDGRVELPALKNGSEDVKYKIYKNAFKDNSDIKTVVIPSNVTAIGESAFKNCSLLEGVTVPASVNEIGNEAFYGCKALSNITLAEGIGSIGVQMFMDCTSLTSITIPSSVTTIGSSAFSGCTKLSEVNFTKYKRPTPETPDGRPTEFYRVTTIDTEAFMGCTSLKSITINDAYSSQGEERNVSFGASVFAGCSNLELVNIPVRGVFNRSGVFDGCTKALIVAPDSSSFDKYQSNVNVKDYNLTYRVELVLKNVGASAPDDKTVGGYYYGIEGQQLPVQDGYRTSVWYTDSDLKAASKLSQDSFNALLADETKINNGKVTLYAYFTAKPKISENNEDFKVTAGDYNGNSYFTGGHLKEWFPKLDIGINSGSNTNFTYTAEIALYIDMSGKIRPASGIVEAGTYTLNIIINNPEDRGIWANGVEFTVGVSPILVDDINEIEWGIANGTNTDYLEPNKDGADSEPVLLYNYKDGKWYTEKQYVDKDKTQEQEHEEDYTVTVLRSYVIWNGEEKTVRLFKANSDYFTVSGYDLNSDITRKDGGRYTATVTVTMKNNYRLLTDEATLKNYGLSVKNTEVNNQYIISKTWYIVSTSANRLLSDSDTNYTIEGWQYMDSAVDVKAPKLAVLGNNKDGAPNKIDDVLSYSLTLFKDDGNLVDPLVTDLNFNHSDFTKYINKAMPAGYYVLNVHIEDVKDPANPSVTYEGGDVTISFTVLEAFTSRLSGVTQINPIANSTIRVNYTGKVVFGVDKTNLPIIGLSADVIHPDRAGTVWEGEAYDDFYTQFVIKYSRSANGPFYTEKEYSDSEPSLKRDYTIFYEISAPSYETLANCSYKLVIQGTATAPTQADLRALDITYNKESLVNKINFNSSDYDVVYLNNNTVSGVKTEGGYDVNPTTLREKLRGMGKLPEAYNKPDSYDTAGEHWVVLFLRDYRNTQWDSSAGAIDVDGFGKVVVLKIEIKKADNSTESNATIRPWDWGSFNKDLNEPKWGTKFPVSYQFKIISDEQRDEDNEAKITYYYYDPVGDQLGFKDAPAGDYWLIPVAEADANVNAFDTSWHGFRETEWFFFTIEKATITWASMPHVNSWKYGDKESDKAFTVPVGRLPEAFTELENTWTTYICLEKDYSDTGEIENKYSSPAELRDQNGFIPKGNWVYVFELPASGNYNVWRSPVYFTVLGADNHWNVTPIIHDFVYGEYKSTLISSLPYELEFETNVGFKFRYFNSEGALIVSWRDSIKDLGLLDENGQLPVGKYEYEVTADSSVNYDKLTFKSEFYVTVSDNSWNHVPNIVGWAEGRYSSEQNAPEAEAAFGTVYFTVKTEDGKAIAGLEHVTAAEFNAEKLKALKVGNYKLYAEVEESKTGDYKGLKAEVNFAVFEDSVSLTGLIAATVVFAVIALGLAAAGIYLLIRRNKKIEEEFRKMVKTELEGR